MFGLFVENSRILFVSTPHFIGEEKGSGATSPALGYAGMFDFFGELKRILISLTEVASLVQHVNSDEGQESDMETDETEIHVSWLLNMTILNCYLLLLLVLYIFYDLNLYIPSIFIGKFSPSLICHISIINDQSTICKTYVFFF